MNGRKVPRQARVLTTYRKFESYLGDFCKGRYPCLWIVGRPGISKSESIHKAMVGQDHFYQNAGHVTPLQFYKNCYLHRGKHLILDDGDALLENPIGVKLLSALTDTRSPNLMSYRSTTKVLEDTPREFLTTSSLCIISNKATADEAILSRATMLHFSPSNLEVHKQVAKWFWCQEIHDWFGQHLTDLRPMEARWYLMAAADMEAGRNWRRIVRKVHGLGELAMLIKEIEADTHYRTRTAKTERFLELAKGMRGASRASYMRFVVVLKKNGQLRNKVTDPIQLRYAPAAGEVVANGGGRAMATRRR
jgi:hypothetical protein